MIWKHCAQNWKAEEEEHREERKNPKRRKQSQKNRQRKNWTLWNQMKHLQKKEDSEETCVKKHQRNLCRKKKMQNRRLMLRHEAVDTAEHEPADNIEGKLWRKKVRRTERAAPRSEGSDETSERGQKCLKIRGGKQKLIRRRKCWHGYFARTTGAKQQKKKTT